MLQLDADVGLRGGCRLELHRQECGVCANHPQCADLCFDPLGLGGVAALRRLDHPAAQQVGVEPVGKSYCGSGDAGPTAGGNDLALEFVAVASATAACAWMLEFWSVHVSTYVEVDTMLLTLASTDKMTSLDAYT